MAAIRRTTHFSGNVQGVGFRWNTRNAAGGHDVAGYVRNLPDGRVEVVAEGETREVEAFLAEVRSRMGGHIRDETHQDAPADGRYSGFAIKH
jgi:acylphosphatase